jgi:uncharacterized Zn finger protein
VTVDPDELLGRIRGQLSDDDFDDLVTMLGQARSQRGGAGTKPPRGGGRRTFGHTWWGRAWVDALEHRAHLDPNRLPRGRTYARQNRVLSIEAHAGEVRAFVQGSRPRPYHVVVAVRPFSDSEWEAVLDAIAAKAAHAAALLDGELLPEIVDEAELLPGPGDLVPNCSCPDWADPCKHAAAVCYLIADLLDADPFTLFALRGRDRKAVLAEVRARRQGRSGAGGRRRGRRADGGTGPGNASPESATPTVTAVATFAAAAEVSPVDRRRRLAELERAALPERPTAPAPLAVEPPVESEIEAEDLTALGADAAERAFGVLALGRPTGLELTAEQDLARRAAQCMDDDDTWSAAGEDELAWLAHASGVPVHLLRRDAEAWAVGGAEAIDVLHCRWAPRTDQLAPGRDAIAAAIRGGTRVRASGNQLVAGPTQLRLAPSGRWYRLEKSAGHWALRRPPEDDPAELFGR